MEQTKNLFWENDIYSKNQHLNKYPYDNVVSFIFRNYPKNISKNQIKILEIGSGAGNNLWFAAREGFDVTGIDGSQSAIKYATQRFDNENLKANFIVADFTATLPFEENTFDLVIDRASLTCCSWQGIQNTVGEVNRVLKKGGKFFSNTYSVKHDSYPTGTQNNNGTRSSFQSGTLRGIDHIYFFDEKDINLLFEEGWILLDKIHKTVHHSNQDMGVHTEWEIIVEKI